MHKGPRKGAGSPEAKMLQATDDTMAIWESCLIPRHTCQAGAKAPGTGPFPRRHLCHLS